MNRISWLAYVAAIVVVIVDQLTKQWIAVGLLEKGAAGPIQVLPFFKLSMVWNPGVSFGLFNAPEWRSVSRWVLTAFAAAVVIVLGLWVRKAPGKVMGLGVGLIMGGAAGNLIDRLRFGQVADFLDFGPLFPWVFNVADAAINVGVALLLIDVLFLERRRLART